MDGLMMEVPLTLQSILRRAANVFPEQEVVSRLAAGDLHRYTYGEFYLRVLRLMNALRELGVRPGDRVATFAWNGHRHLELYFAIPCLGAVLHTVNVRLAPEQIEHIVGHAQDRFLFVDGSLVDVLAPLAARLGCVERIVVMDDDRGGAAAGLPDALDYETLLAQSDEREDFPELDERQAAGLCYTSGTTGDPKGVLYSHRAYYLHSLGAGMVDSMAVSQGETVMPVVPMFHANAWGFPFSSVLTGARQVLPGAQLLGRPLAELIEGEGVTLAAGVPTVWTVLLAHLRKTSHDVSSLRSIIVGGSAAPLALIRAYRDEFGITMTHAWGMTETTPVGCCSRLKRSTLQLPAEDQLVARTKQGVPVPGIEMRAVDDDGKDVPRDGKSVGELLVRGPWVAREYYRDPGNPAFRDDGWFRTGDVVTIDGLGYVEITDRVKDLIKCSGEWISSVALENTAVAHESILEAAVTGRPDTLRGEVPVLWVVPEPGAQLDAAQITAFLGEHVPGWQVPRLSDVRFVDAIPKTSVGKFDKKLLRRREPSS